MAPRRPPRSNDAPDTENGATPATVTVEGVSWINQLMGGPGRGSMEWEEPVAAGETVRSLLRRLTDRHPKLREALWDRPNGELGAAIEVVVNGEALGVAHDLDSPLAPGDRIMLLGQYVGG